MKRKPTFNEILGLLSEDQTLLRPFQTEQQHSLEIHRRVVSFDGSDHVELLKEQQNRVLDRQMREMILRRQAQQNGGTFHVDRHNDNFSSGESVSDSGMMTPSEASSSQIMYHADLQRGLEERARQETQRRQEVRQRRGEAVNRLNDTLTRNMLRSGFNDLRGMPEAEPLQTDVSDEELIPADDTVRPYQKNILYFNNDIEAMKNNERLDYNDLLFQLYVRGRLTDEITNRVEALPDDISRKIYLLTIVRDLIGDGTGDNNWQIGVESNLLNSRIREWRQVKRGGGKGLLRQFLASAGSVGADVAKTALQEVGKGLAKGAVSALTGT